MLAMTAITIKQKRPLSIELAKIQNLSIKLVVGVRLVSEIRLGVSAAASSRE